MNYRPSKVNRVVRRFFNS